MYLLPIFHNCYQDLASPPVNECAVPSLSIGNTSAAVEFSEALRRRQAAFDAIFWNETEGIWRDWDQDSRAHLAGFYASSFVPLLWGCNPPNISKHEKVLRTLNALGVLDFPGGIPASLNKLTTQQWDFPNVWAPLQWFPVVGWYSSTSVTLRDAAYSIAQKWISTTFVAWETNNQSIFEKVRVHHTVRTSGGRIGHYGASWLAGLLNSALYCFVLHQYDCTEQGLPGSGGEYMVQVRRNQFCSALIREAVHLLLLVLPSTPPHTHTHKHRRGLAGLTQWCYTS